MRSFFTGEIWSRAEKKLIKCYQKNKAMWQYFGISLANFPQTSVFWSFRNFVQVHAFVRPSESSCCHRNKTGWTVLWEQRLKGLTEQASLCSLTDRASSVWLKDKKNGNILFWRYWSLFMGHLWWATFSPSYNLSRGTRTISQQLTPSLEQRRWTWNSREKKNTLKSRWTDGAAPVWASSFEVKSSTRNNCFSQRNPLKNTADRLVISHRVKGLLQDKNTQQSHFQWLWSDN